MATSKILIISLSVGEGHNRTAQALESVIKDTYPEVSVEVIDSFDYAPRIFRKLYVAPYVWMVTKIPATWRYVYDRYDKEKADSISAKVRHLFYMLNLRGLVKYIKKSCPDRIICTHFLPTEIVSDLRRSGKINIPTYVVVTDYYINAFWIYKGIDRYFVSNEEAKWALIHRGVDEDAVDAFGIPIHPFFSEKPNRDAILRSLELDEGKSTVLLLSGGGGWGDIEGVVDTIATLEWEMQLLVVAGWNDKLRMRLARKKLPEHITLRTFGFVNNIHELMEVSNLVITKPGGLTMSECLAKGLPMVIITTSPDLAERDSRLLLEAGAAVKVSNSASLGYKLRRLLDDRRKLNHMREAALSIAHPDAAFNIVDRVMEGEESLRG